MSTSPPDASVRLHLKCPDADDFVVRFAPNVTRGGVFLPTRDAREVGASIRFEVALLDDTVVFAGDGIVTWVKPKGMGIKFTTLDPASKPMLERLLTQREAPTEAAPAPAPELPAKPAAPPPVRPATPAPAPAPAGAAIPAPAAAPTPPRAAPPTPAPLPVPPRAPTPAPAPARAATPPPALVPARAATPAPALARATTPAPAPVPARAATPAPAAVSLARAAEASRPTPVPAKVRESSTAVVSRPTPPAHPVSRSPTLELSLATIVRGTRQPVGRVVAIGAAVFVAVAVVWMSVGRARVGTSRSGEPARTAAGEIVAAPAAPVAAVATPGAGEVPAPPAAAMAPEPPAASPEPEPARDAFIPPPNGAPTPRPASARGGGVRVERMLAATSYKNFTCPNPSKRFSARASRTVNVCLQMAHKPGRTEHLTLVWERNGGFSGKTRVEVPSSKTTVRTRARLKISGNRVGSWSARLVSDRNAPLAETSFEVVP